MKSVVYIALAVLFALSSSMPVFAAPANDVNAFSCADVTEIPQGECEALVALYNSTNGPGWTDSTNWLVTNTPSNWCGVTVTAGHVRSINLFFNQLVGLIPIELQDLTSLTQLYLGTNQLSGTIPPELGNITSLTELELSRNLLTGSLPHELGNLVNMFMLDLSDNQFTGSIPTEIFGLSGLQILYLLDNQLSGSIPPGLGNLTNLQMLYLDGNQFTGSIPIELFSLSNLTYLSLSRNQLSGTIPVGLANLPSLSSLNLSQNLFSGSIPLELTDIVTLASLDLSYNQLTGTIPVELSNMPNLLALYLDYNQLNGSIPPELGNLHQPLILSLAGNQLSGNIPAELGNMNSLWILHLQDNLLEGDIPSTFVNLVGLLDPGHDGLDLDYNRLNVPPGYPDPLDPLQVFLSQKDPEWQLYQGFQQVIGIGGGELTSLDGRTDFLIPEGALITDTTFTFMPQPLPHQRHVGLAFAHNSFDLTAEDGIGNPVTSFNLPVTVTLTYTYTDNIGIPEDTLGLYYWDEAVSTWADAVTTCLGGEYTRNSDGNTFALPLCHLTEFGVFGTPIRIFLPVTNR